MEEPPLSNVPSKLLQLQMPLYCSPPVRMVGREDLNPEADTQAKLGFEVMGCPHWADTFCKRGGGGPQTCRFPDPLSVPWSPRCLVLLGHVVCSPCLQYYLLNPGLEEHLAAHVPAQGSVQERGLWRTMAANQLGTSGQDLGF